MFGVKEHKEKLEIAVSEILETEGQKLQITRCCRIGRAAVGATKPIKDTVGSADMVQTVETE